ncbi:MAG: hypothetical protein KDD63_10430 [Bacteroidetes bacterium]|nr:hypothetical protein [Bacteroidota bacterium]MCB0844163.1 hypothetical protein [Bacteroidota bacterium]MCB0852632.1 hypothetical protein [Bacteroidota bacterium]
MVFTCDILDEINLAKAKTCEVIVTNGIKVPVSQIPDGIKIIDANKYRIEGSWHAYQEDEKALQKIRELVPQLFVYKGFDLYPALLKSIYWTNFRQGYIDVALEKCGLINQELINGDSGGIKDLVKDRILTTYYALSRGKEPHKKVPEMSGKSVKYLFVIESVLLIQFWEKLIDQFPPNETGIFILAEREHIPKEMIDHFRERGMSVFYEEVFPDIKPPFFNPFSVPGAYLPILKNLLKVWGGIVNFLENMLFFTQGDTRAIIVNAAENNFYGHILAQLRGKANFKVYNTMNGNKFATPNNSDAEFDAWFVWDEMLKDLLEKDCRLPVGQVVNIGGHLMQDKIKSHSYGHTLPLSDQQLEKMKIISFGSCRGRRKDKIDALETLYQWMKNNPDTILLYRPHPAEKREDFFLPEGELQKRVILVEYNPDTIKQTLYDQLIISHVMIALGSTVLLEAKWADLPAITFEQKETSFVYCVDEKYIWHCKTPDSLVERVEGILSSPREIQLNRENRESDEVARKYADYMIKHSSITN